MSKRTAKSRPESRGPVPEDFTTKMESLLGEEEAGFLVKALDDSPTVSIRLNRRKKCSLSDILGKNGEDAMPVPWCRSGYYLNERKDFIHDPLLHAGVYYVQEAASMIYETLVSDYSPESKETLCMLDLCAAPGGKSTAMLNGVYSLMDNGVIPYNNDYVLVANEWDRKRVKALKENLDKWGDPNVIVTNSSADRFGSLGSIFDIVAVDAPCSGEGMMRREPIARSQWSQKLVDRCSVLQKEILSEAVKALKPGGLLIFSTCTFNDIENEGNVEWLLNNHNLRPLDSPRRFTPSRYRCEGLFVATFIKEKDEDRVSMPGVSYHNLLSRLEKAGIKIMGAGIEKSVKRNSIEVPSSRQVLSIDYDSGSFPYVELTREEAVSYLKRNQLILPPDTPQGYVTVGYLGHPLGLVKNLGSRANNLYPPEWRILT